jgi:hypothetical protein
MEKFHFLSFSRRSQPRQRDFSSFPLSSGFGMKTNSEAAAATIRLPSPTAEENNISMEKPLPERNKKNKSRQLASIFLFISSRRRSPSRVGWISSYLKWENLFLIFALSSLLRPPSFARFYFPFFPCPKLPGWKLLLHLMIRLDVAAPN